MENKKIEDMTLKELKEALVENGLDKATAKAFIAKAQATAVLNMLLEKKLNEKTSKEVIEAQAEVKKVDSIEELPNPTEERNINKSWKSKAEIMMNIWLTEPMKQMMVPAEPGRPAGKVEWRTDRNGKKYQFALTPEDTIKTIQVNGAKWMVPKGTYVDVPTRVADKIARELEMTNNAGKKWLLDREDEKTGMSVRDSL